MSEEPVEKSKKEIYTYQCPWTAYTIAWNRKHNDANNLLMAVGSYKEEYSNQLSVIQLCKGNGGSANKGAADSAASQTPDFSEAYFKKLVDIEHPYPATKMMFAPPKYFSDGPQSKDLLATTGDYLRLWSIDEGDGSEYSVTTTLLNNNKQTEYCAPLTSFDWNEADPNLIGTCSIDTTCTIWDVTTKTPKTQLIAHDKEV
jgi:WD repeat-containing protein 68